MALITKVQVDEALLARAAEAERDLRETAEYFRSFAVREGLSEGDSPAKMRDRIHEYRKAALAALEDGRRVADEINKSRGIVREYALDLKAARDEVERLLDRFAAAGGEGEVP